MKVFSSDNHHQHRRIVDFTNRGIETSSEEHDEWLVNIWNRDVTKYDEIWHIGDLSFASKYADLAKFVSRLNGNINLIKGNHDKAEFLNRLKVDGLINNWYDYKEIKIGDQTVCLFHFAMMTWHKQGYGSWHLFGHSHGNLTGARGKMLDVGLDSSYNLYGTHRFFNELDVLNYMARQELVITDHHKER